MAAGGQRTAIGMITIKMIKVTKRRLAPAPGRQGKQLAASPAGILARWLLSALTTGSEGDPVVTAWLALFMDVAAKEVA